ncbi:MAG TPA: ATP-binding protein [Acidimicrobiales bacterium]|nr:ATP-binding protein [Acidimicrobiales bacterium]
MSAWAAQLQFAAEFVLFLAAASGVVVVALRRRLLAGTVFAQALLATGFSALAAAAFLHGSLLLEEGDDPVVLLLRGAGVAAAATATAGTAGWAAGISSRNLLWTGLGVLTVAAVVDAVGPEVVAELLVAAGGAALGAAVVTASRGSIAAQVAAGAAVTLLLVVLALGVVLSAVLVSTVREGETDRLEARARNESVTTADSYADRLADAKVAAASLAGQRLDRLVPLAGSPRPSAVVSPDLDMLSSSFLSNVGLAYLARSGTVQGVARLDEPVAVGLAGAQVVRQAIDSGDGRGSVAVVAGRPFTVGVQPVIASVNGVRELLGVVAAASELGEPYLALLGSDDPDLSLALIGHSARAASHGPQPEPDSIRGMVQAALGDGEPSSRAVGGRFVAVAPVRAADGRPVMALVASTPTTLVNDTRNSVFRSLFLTALAGTLLALLLASLVGRRIGVRLRRLTVVAEAIQRGDLSARARIESNDEVGVLGTTLDSMAESIQEKTAAEARLRSRLEAVVAGMGEALVAVDGGGRITDFNRAAEEIFGAHAGQAVGRQAGDLVRLTTDDGAPLAEGWHPPPAPWSGTGWVERADGRRIPVAVSAGPLGGGAGTDVAGTVVVLRDLRREREVEQMKTEFLSRVGHELRTPLSGVMGYAELLNRRKVPAATARDWHAEILGQSRALLRIVEMLEFFAQDAAGGVRLRLEEVDPKGLVDEVVGRWTGRVKEPLAVERRVARRTPAVLADRGWLTSCLDELVDNAVKFSPEGGVITVSCRPAPEDGGVEMAVADKGIGMSEEVQAEAFLDFAQADTSDTRRFGGLGLGLALVRRVVRTHGGSVACESAPGRGTTIYMYLPAAPSGGV